MRARSKATLVAICLTLLLSLVPATVQAKGKVDTRLAGQGQKWR